MKRVILLVHLCLFIFSINSQNKLIHFGSTNFDGINAIKVNNNGEVYATGYFQGSLDSENLISKGNTDAFIGKYSNTGELIWMTNIGSDVRKVNEINEFGQQLVIDNQENIYTVGLFYQKVIINENHKIASKGKQDIFISKHSKEGKLLWIKSIGNIGNESIVKLLIDENNNTYLIGKQFKEVNNKLNRTEESFISKFSSSGNLIWTKYLDEDNKDLVDIKDAFLNEGEIYILSSVIGKNKELSGNFSKLNLDGFKTDLKSIDLQSDIIGFDVNSKKEIFILSKPKVKVKDISLYNVVMINKNGKVIWQKDYTNSIDFKATKLVVEKDNFMVIGEFSGNLQTPDNSAFIGFSDILIFKHSGNGEVRGLDVFDGKGQNRVNQIVIKRDKIYFAGQFYNELNINNQKLYSNGKSDAFVIINKFEEQIATYDLNYLIYPNPNKGEFEIKNIIEVDKIEIFDLLGRLIFSKSVSNISKIKVPNLQNAVYNLFLYKEGHKLYSTKIIINK